MTLSTFDEIIQAQDEIQIRIFVLNDTVNILRQSWIWVQSGRIRFSRRRNPSSRRPCIWLCFARHYPGIPQSPASSNVVSQLYSPHYSQDLLVLPAGTHCHGPPRVHSSTTWRLQRSSCNSRSLLRTDVGNCEQGSPWWAAKLCTNVYDSSSFSPFHSPEIINAVRVIRRRYPLYI